MVPGNVGVLGPTGLAGSVDVSETAGNVVMQIATPSGELVRSIDLGPRPEGALRFAWDGTTDAGETMPPGVYQVRAFSAVGSTQQELTVNLPDQVISVSIGEDGVMANLASGAAVAASQIKEIQ